MGINSVSNQQQITFGNKEPKITNGGKQLKTAPKNNVDKTPSKDTVELSNTNNGTKAGIVACALAILTGLGIFAYSKGKKSSALKKAQEQAKREADEAARITKEKATEEARQQKLKKLEEEARIAKEKAEKAKKEADEAARVTQEKLAKEAELKAKQEAELAEKLAKENENRIDLSQELDLENYGDTFRNNLSAGYGMAKGREHTKATVDTIKELEHATFDMPDLKLIRERYDAEHPFDLGLRYAVVANNTAKATGSGAIINEVPEIFKGIESKELVKALDKLPVHLENRKINKFTIGEKEFTAEFVGSGQINTIYKISDKAGNKICFRSAKDPYLMTGGQGIYNETAITQEAFKAGVVDIPKLYMANPVGRYVNDGYISGSWQLLEFVEKDRQISKDGLKLFDWLKSKGLAHFDFNDGTVLGNTVVDLGGINDLAKTYEKAEDMFWLVRGYQKGETTTEMLKGMTNII